MTNFSAGNHKEEMTFLMSKVSVACMMYAMSHLAFNCAAEDNKTTKQISPIAVCCSVVIHADINSPNSHNVYGILKGLS